MASTYAEARNALTGLAYTTWNTATGSAPLLYDNKGAERPKTPVLHGRVTIQHFGGALAALGGKRHRRTGRMYVQVFEPKGEGMSDLDTIANAMVEAFEDAGAVGNVWFRNVGAKQVGTDGVYRQMNVEVDFTWDRVQ